MGAVLPAVVDYFGGRNVSGIIGILYTSVAFGTLIGPRAAGFASAAANIVAALIVTIMIRPAPVHDRS